MAISQAQRPNANLKTTIQNLIKGEVSDDPQTLAKDSHDASLFEIKPAVVVYPKDVEDIKNLVKFVTKEKEANPTLALTARSAGTDMTGGPLSESIVLEMTKYFNHLKEVGADYAVTEPGVFYRDFEKEILKHNLLLPSYPASRELCTVGGMVANNSGGEKNLKYGKTENYVERLKMVMEDGEEHVFEPLTIDQLEEKKTQVNYEGEIYRGISDLVLRNYDVLKNAKPKVSKNSAGYYLWNVWDPARKIFDLNKVIVGSQGTFGIITEIKFKLIKPEPHSSMLVIFLHNMDHLAELINLILAHHPESFESYDDHTLKLAMKFMPDMARTMKGSFIKLAISFLPEVWMLLRGGFPKLVLLAEFTGDTAEEAQAAARAASDSIKHLHLTSKLARNEIDEKKYWVVRRESFNLLRRHTKGLRTAPFIDDFIVQPNDLPEFLPKLYKIMDNYKIIYTIAGHVGDGNFHIIPLMNLADPKSKDIIEKLGNEVYELVLSYHGSITAEHNDGFIRSPYLKEMYGEEVYKLFEETKSIFDPKNIFNPGKKVGASFEYAMEHLVRSS